MPRKIAALIALALVMLIAFSLVYGPSLAASPVPVANSNITPLFFGSLTGDVTTATPTVIQPTVIQYIPLVKAQNAPTAAPTPIRTPMPAPTVPTATQTPMPTATMTQVPIPTPTTTQAPIPTPTTTAIATQGPTATPTLPPPTYNNCQADPSPNAAPHYPVRIVSIDKQAETVTLRNDTVGETIDLTNWDMCSVTGNQHHPISGTLAPGETKTFINNGGSIWNNSSSDPGALYNSSGQLVSYYPD